MTLASVNPAALLSRPRSPARPDARHAQPSPARGTDAAAGAAPAGAGHSRGVPAAGCAPPGADGRADRLLERAAPDRGDRGVAGAGRDRAARRATVGDEED